MIHDLYKVAQVAAMGVVLAASGCTTSLNAHLVSPESKVPAAGAPYFLNFTQYEITATRRVAGCETDDGDKALLIATHVKVKQAEERDPKRHYIIDLESMQKASKKIELKVQYYESGALKAVNASAEDRSGEIATSVIATAGKIALAIAGVPTLKKLDDVPPPEDQVLRCADDIPGILEAVEADKIELKALTRKIAEASAELAHLTALAGVLGDTRTDEDRRKHAEAMEALETATKDHAAVTASMKANLKKISVTQTKKWPADGEMLTSIGPVIEPLTSKQLAAWSKPAQVKPATAKVYEEQGEPVPRMVTRAEETGVWARIEATTPFSRRPCTDCAADEPEGLKYRMPAPGRLLLCAAPTCVESDDEDANEIHAAKAGLVSQLGPIFVLPLKSGPFSDKSIEAAFAENGMPQALGVKSSAAAEKGATVIGDITEQALSSRSQLVSDELTRTQAEIELLKAEAELAAARQALEPPAADPYAEQSQAAAAFAADTTLLQAELAYLEARAKLEEAREQAAED